MADSPVKCSGCDVPAQVILEENLHKRWSVPVVEHRKVTWTSSDRLVTKHQTMPPRQSVKPLEGV